jgi:hypothetical protein
MHADMALGAYRIIKAEGALPPLVWSEKTFAELLKIGFDDRIISDEMHPVIRKLKGLS